MQKILSIVLFFVCSQLQAQDIDVLHYRFELGLNDKNDSIQGKAIITMLLKERVAAIPFDLQGIGHGNKGMSIEKVVLNEPQDPMQDYFIIDEKGDIIRNWEFLHENNKILIPVFFYKKGDTATATILYKGIPADGLIISKNKYGDRTFFADNWPNRAHHWIPCVDRPDDKASFEFIVTAPVHYNVISNGLKVEEKETGGGMKLTHWREDTPQPTKVMVIGAARFATKTYADSPEGVPVSAWVYPQDSTKGFYDYALAPGIVKFFAEYIAPFPYKKLANVQSKTIFGGMENASAIFYAENSVTGDRSSEDLLAHEIAHQWFGDMASEKSFAHLWLSEGFATYLTHYYFEKKYGKEAAAERLKQDREEVIAFAKQSGSAVVDSTENLMSLLNANSYQKGGWVLHMLRQEVGDTAFQKIIREYYRQYKGGNAETRDFEAVAESVSGKELTWFFDQWLYRPGVPVLQVSSKVQGNEFVLHVNQIGTPYQFKLDVDIITKEGEVIRKQVDVRDKVTILNVPIKGLSVKLTIDPDTKLLYRLKD